LTDGGVAESAGFMIHGLPAAHEADKRDDLGRCHFMGFVVQFGSHAIYHSGDTMLFEGMVEKLKPFKVDLALLPINGRGPERCVAGNLWGREAAELAQSIGAATVIPCHYDMFDFNTDTPKQFTDICAEVDQPFCVLENGGRWTCGGA
jgi:L-ascorbate metabolism protein UlaG (beta-lactamase superfamily)